MYAYSRLLNASFDPSSPNEVINSSAATLASDWPPANEAAIPRYQYMPFGAGPRVCIGMPFAMMEATAMLATFLQHARFEVVDREEPVPVARVTLIPRGGLRLGVSA